MSLPPGRPAGGYARRVPTAEALLTWMRREEGISRAVQ